MLLRAPAALEVMRSPLLFPKPPMTRALLREAVGASGLLLTEGAPHTRLRRTLAPLFHAPRARAYARPMLLHARALAAKWVDAAPGEIASVYEDVSRCSMRIIGALALGGHDAGGGEGGNALFEAYRAFLERHANMSHAALIVTMLAPGLARYAPLKEIKDARNLLTEIRARVEDTVARKRKLHAARAAKDQPPPDGDFLDVFLAAQDPAADSEEGEGPALTAEEVIDNALTFMAAGHATTSAATCWLLFHLATQPTAQTALRTELATAFPDGLGEDDDEKEVEDDADSGGGGGEAAALAAKLDALPLLEATVLESLRLTPGINMTARISAADAVVGGVSIPRGTVVSIPMQALQRDASVWGEAATEFRPSRWHAGGGQASTAWLPFLAGPRACVGRRVALLEMKAIITALMLAGVRLRAAPGSEPTAAGVILVPAGMSLGVDVVGALMS